MKKKTPQVIWVWTGEAMRPVEMHVDLCRAEFEAGKRYKMIAFEERSRETHDHFFRIVAGYWHHWPERYGRDLADADQLRKHLLISTGHYVQSVMAHDSREAAAGYVRDFKRYVDYAEGAISGGGSDIVTVMRIAKSQAKKVMEADEFQKSKQDVLEACQAVTGLTPEQITDWLKRKGAAA